MSSRNNRRIRSTPFEEIKLEVKDGFVNLPKAANAVLFIIR